MKSSAIALLAVSLLAGSTALAADKTQQDILWSADAIKWEAGPLPGTKVAKLWGDWMKGGPFGVLVKFDGGMMNPLHHHSHALKIVVISGTFVHKNESGVESKLGPGSYMMQASGKKHSSGCAAGAECQFVMSSDDKFDLIEDKAKK